MTLHLRLVAVLTAVLCTAALVAPSSIAGTGLSKEKARQTAKVYGAELCLAAEDRCQSFEVTTCVRSSPRKVACRTVWQLKHDETCRYVLVVTKKDGEVTGRIKGKGNTCF